MGRSRSASTRFPARLLVCLALAAAVLAVYGRAPGFAFVCFDDNAYVYHNPIVQAGLTQAGALWALTSTATSNWHPLTWLSLMLDAQIGGASPWTFHVTNLLLHLANTLLVYALFERMTGQRARSAVVAALFGVHPLHVESVAWIAERKDVLSTLFWILSMLAYLRYVERPRASRYLLVVLLVAAGLMAKPMLVTAPLLLLVLDRWPLGRRGLPTLVVEKIPLLVLSGASSALAVYAQKQAGALGGMELFPLRARIGNALVAYAAYAGKAIWPSGLSVFYPYRGAALGGMSVSLAATFLVAATTLAILAARRRPYLLAGWLWYLITLFPVIGIVQVGLQSMADRYTYVPLLGLFLIAAWGLPDLLSIVPERPRRIATVSAGALALAALAIAARRQAGYWSDGVTLFGHAVAVTSENAVAHHLLGSALHDLGDNQGALTEWNEAVRIVPDYVNARCDLAGVLVQLGRIDEGEAQYRRVLTKDPEHARAHARLGTVLASLKRYDEAIVHLSAALGRHPDDAETESNLGVALLRQHRYPEAVAHLSRAVQLDSRSREARLRLATALADAGRTREAAAQLEDLLRLYPGDASARRALAFLRESAGERESSASP